MQKISMDNLYDSIIPVLPREWDNRSVIKETIKIYTGLDVLPIRRSPTRIRSLMQRHMKGE